MTIWREKTCARSVQGNVAFQLNFGQYNRIRFLLNGLPYLQQQCQFKPGHFLIEIFNFWSLFNANFCVFCEKLFKAKENVWTGLKLTFFGVRSATAVTTISLDQWDLQVAFSCNQDHTVLEFWLRVDAP